MGNPNKSQQLPPLGPEQKKQMEEFLQQFHLFNGNQAKEPTQPETTAGKEGKKVPGTEEKSGNGNPTKPSFPPNWKIDGFFSWDKVETLIPNYNFKKPAPTHWLFKDHQFNELKGIKLGPPSALSQYQAFRQLAESEAKSIFQSLSHTKFPTEAELQAWEKQLQNHLDRMTRILEEAKIPMKLFGRDLMKIFKKAYGTLGRMAGHMVKTESIEDVDRALALMEKYGTLAGESAEKLKAKKLKIYRAGYIYFKDWAQELIFAGANGEDLDRTLAQMVQWGTKTGRSPGDILEDRKDLYRGYLVELSNKSQELAKKGDDGAAFNKTLKAKERVRKLAGISETKVDSLQQLAFAELYKFSLDELRGKCSDGSCPRPDKDIRFTGPSIKVNDTHHPKVVYYGRRAGKTRDELGKDVEKLKGQVKADNLKLVKQNLLEGHAKAVNAPKSLPGKIIDRHLQILDEAELGIQSLAWGVGNYSKRTYLGLPVRKSVIKKQLVGGAKRLFGAPFRATRDSAQYLKQARDQATGGLRQIKDGLVLFAEGWLT